MILIAVLPLLKVSVTVNVNGGSRCGTDCKMDCCADVKNRLTAIEQALQQIVLAGNATNPTTSPTATPTSERDPLRSCKETLDQGFAESGVYTIDPDDGYGPFEMCCNMETAGGVGPSFRDEKTGLSTSIEIGLTTKRDSAIWTKSSSLVCTKLGG